MYLVFFSPPKTKKNIRPADAQISIFSKRLKNTDKHDDPITDRWVGKREA
jgi:hypothetical protein